MKRLLKCIVNIVAVVMLAVCCFSFTACEDIKKLELTMQIYDYSKEKMYDEEDVKITIELYRHLAPKTVDAIISYVNEGYYDGTFFYLIDEVPLGDADTADRLMIGDLKFDANGNVVQNQIKPMLDGEFEQCGTTGSNLVNNEGYVGLWRSWFAQDANSRGFKATNGMDSARSTMYFPLGDLSGYNGYFCVFATIDLSKSANDTGINGAGMALSGENYTDYTVYYTGEYDKTKPNDNFGLTFHCIPSTEYRELPSEERNKVFVASGDQFVCYNKYEIRVPTMIDGQCPAMIKSAKIK